MAKGKRQVELQAKEVNMEIGHYPGPKHRISTCCDAMYETHE